MNEYSESSGEEMSGGDHYDMSGYSTSSAKAGSVFPRAHYYYNISGCSTSSGEDDIPRNYLAEYRKLKRLRAQPGFKHTRT